MASITLELSEHVIDAIADAVVKKMQKPCSCDYYDADNKTCRRSEVPKEPCEDCISRDAVQNYVESHIQEINTGYGDLNNHTNRILRMIVDGIRNLPSIQPKTKTDIIDKIKTIVDEWKADTWTDNISYECMIKIADILAESEGNYGED